MIQAVPQVTLDQESQKHGLCPHIVLRFLLTSSHGGGVTEGAITFPLKLVAKPLLAYSDTWVFMRHDMLQLEWLSWFLAWLCPLITDGGRSPLSICSRALTHASESKTLCASLSSPAFTPAGKGSINLSVLLFLRLCCSHFRSSHLFFSVASTTSYSLPYNPSACVYRWADVFLLESLHYA